MSLSKKRHNYKLNSENCFYLKSKKHYVIQTALITLKKTINPQIKSQTVILKKFNDNIPNWKSRLENEIISYSELIKILGKEFLPRRLGFTSYAILYEKIEGFMLQKLLLSSNLSDTILNQLAFIYHKLHKNSLIFGDSRLTNFLANSKQLYIIDYEDIKPGNSINDISNLLISFIDINPGILSGDIKEIQIESMFKTLKYYWIYKFGEQYEQLIKKDYEIWTSNLFRALLRTLSRRNISLNQNEIQKLKKRLNEIFFSYFPSYKL